MLEHVATRRTYLGRHAPDFEVRLFGDTAVMTGGYRQPMRAPQGGERARSTASSTQVSCERTTTAGWRFV